MCDFERGRNVTSALCRSQASFMMSPLYCFLPGYNFPKESVMINARPFASPCEGVVQGSFFVVDPDNRTFVVLY